MRDECFTLNRTCILIVELIHQILILLDDNLEVTSNEEGF